MRALFKKKKHTHKKDHQLSILLLHIVVKCTHTHIQTHQMNKKMYKNFKTTIINTPKELKANASLCYLSC